MTDHSDIAVGYGLIFKDAADDIWLGKYENGSIKEFGTLSDMEDIYEDLPLEKFAFVEIKEEEFGRLWINDISRFEIGKRSEGSVESIDPKPVTELLTSMNFPSDDCDNMFRSFLHAAGKAN